MLASALWPTENLDLVGLSPLLHPGPAIALCTQRPHLKPLIDARRYAWECQTQEGGWGLDGVLREHSWKLRGIVNGMDYSEWSPGADPHLRSDGFCNYGTDDLATGKAQCKAALQRVRACLDPSSPVSSFSSILSWTHMSSYRWAVVRGVRHTEIAMVPGVLLLHVRQRICKSLDGDPIVSVC